MDGKLDPSFRGKTDSQHLEEGIVVTFDYALPEKWEDKTTVYVVHSSGAETALSNEENETPDTFSFKPFDWATLHVNIIKFEADRPPQGGPRVKLVHGWPGVDPVCGPRPMQVLGL